MGVRGDVQAAGELLPPPPWMQCPTRLGQHAWRIWVTWYCMILSGSMLPVPSLLVIFGHMRMTACLSAMPAFWCAGAHPGPVCDPSSASSCRGKGHPRGWQGGQQLGWRRSCFQHSSARPSRWRRWRCSLLSRPVGRWQAVWCMRVCGGCCRGVCALQGSGAGACPRQGGSCAGQQRQARAACRVSARGTAAVPAAAGQ